ncbi:hypothetical protein JAAARDRAFT_485411 [Jaapia argillacea MUCL 33604]|uniref:F-box domain-containing protein n=1 Tax=Jaapia argillacea MUCL 33604 TaxID=933084 RepID=A0A067PEE6_9AGAM|nr:hypothetical protein JAAARDRAFT_485411 [Jaapia argillacea MUCL 33604]
MDLRSDESVPSARRCRARKLVKQGSVYGDHSANNRVEQINEAPSEYMEHPHRWRIWLNTFAPVSRLPPELLVEVFVLCTRGYCHPSADLDWIKVTHVCHNWRQVALRAAHLWTRLPIGNERWVIEMLLRSNNAPLVVLCHHDHEGFTGLDAALQNLDRVRELSTVVPHWNAQWSSPAPLLEVLRVTTGVGPLTSPKSHMTIPRDLFRGTTPSLRTIHINRCSADWTSPFFCCLTHLNISEILRASRPTLDEIFKILQRCPELETLFLHQCIHSSEDWRVPSQTIILPRLARVDMNAPSRDCHNLLHHIDFPPTTSLSLRMKIDDVADTKPFLSYLTHGPPLV